MGAQVEMLVAFAEGLEACGMGAGPVRQGAGALEQVERLHSAACERLADYSAEIGSQTARAQAAEAKVEALRSALEGTLKLLANFQVSGPAVKVARAALDAPPEPVRKAEEFAPPAGELFAENAKKSAEETNLQKMQRPPAEESAVYPAGLDWESIAEARAAQLKDLGVRYSLYSMAIRNAVDILVNRGRFGDPDDALACLRGVLSTEAAPAEARSEQPAPNTFEVGKPAPYFCPACQAIPRAGYCKLAGCPTAPKAEADQLPDAGKMVGHACEACGGTGFLLDHETGSITAGREA